MAPTLNQSTISITANNVGNRLLNAFKLRIDQKCTLKSKENDKITKMHAIRKPGKDGNDATDYRPISLLNSFYKALKQLIYNRITQMIDSIPSVVQADLGNERSYCEQVMSPTAFIESGFQKRLKTGAVFIDLSSAYDIIWRGTDPKTIQSSTLCLGYSFGKQYDN
ncbi:Reverse transcriptase domain [Cinara cedri]|uniref:Reverse transcriptase domain n=1 Tax=Cinara cedri TaxID=506608 RepID=A0A5E4MCK2_9HEMI|nr:Reverse transcriptase domain [Cinara cedri]